MTSLNKQESDQKPFKFKQKDQLRSADSKLPKFPRSSINSPLISDIENKSINVNAINRTQDLINMIKTAILSSISEKE